MPVPSTGNSTRSRLGRSVWLEGGDYLPQELQPESIPGTTNSWIFPDIHPEKTAAGYENA